MYRALIAIAFIITGATAATAQGYGHGGYGGYRGHGFRGPGPVVVLPYAHRPYGWGHRRFDRHPRWHRPWHRRGW